MARDCPDRQRGTDWRNHNGFPGQRKQIGGGDAVEREMEVSRLYFHNYFIFLLGDGKKTNAFLLLATYARTLGRRTPGRR